MALALRACSTSAQLAAAARFQGAPPLYGGRARYWTDGSVTAGLDADALLPRATQRAEVVEAGVKLCRQPLRFRGLGRLANKRVCSSCSQDDAVVSQRQPFSAGLDHVWRNAVADRAAHPMSIRLRLQLFADRSGCRSCTCSCHCTLRHRLAIGMQFVASRMMAPLLWRRELPEQSPAR